MSDIERIAAAVTAPMAGTASATDTRPEQRLAGSGTFESTVAHGLQAGRMATLMVGANPVRISFRGAAGVANAVAATSLALPAYGRFDWLVQDDTRFPYVEAADGASSYEAWAWSSSAGTV